MSNEYRHKQFLNGIRSACCLPVAGTRSCYTLTALPERLRTPTALNTRARPFGGLDLNIVSQKTICTRPNSALLIPLQSSKDPRSSRQDTLADDSRQCPRSFSLAAHPGGYALITNR